MFVKKKLAIYEVVILWFCFLLANAYTRLFAAAKSNIRAPFRRARSFSHTFAIIVVQDLVKDFFGLALVTARTIMTAIVLLIISSPPTVPHLPKNQVFTLWEDEDRIIWAGTR